MQRVVTKEELIKLIEPKFMKQLRDELSRRFENSSAMRLVIFNYVKTLFSNDTTCRQLMLQTCATLANVINNIHMSNIQQDHYINQRMIDDDIISAGINAVVAYLCQNQHLMQSHNVNTDFNLTEILQQLPEILKSSIEDRYKGIDDRQIENEGRLVRRMNSLSRIFRLIDGFSVCNAVAVHQGEIVMAFNISDNKQHKKVSDITSERIAILQQHLAKVREIVNKYPGDPIKALATYHAQQEKLCTETCDALFAVGPNSLGKALVMQALEKLTHTIFFDKEETFCPEMKAAFFREKLSVSVLLPVVDKHTNLSLLCNDQLIPTKFKTNSVSFAHAEQMVAYHIFENLKAEYQPEAPLVIGITKLCCQACRNNLMPLSVDVCGSHGENAKDTLCMFGVHDRDEEMRDTPVRRVTYPQQSPQSTVKSREILLNTNPHAKRSMLFGDNEEVSSDVELPDLNVKEKKKHRDDEDDKAQDQDFFFRK